MVAADTIEQAADYVVVGAGSAGCVLADRLSADGRSSVTVIEAGGNDRSLWVRMPIGYGGAFHHPHLNWRFTTEPDEGLGGRQSYWPRGKVVGGSSSINGMVFVRGQAADFDGWAAAGNPGWDYASVLPCFRRLEDNLNGADEWRGAGGPMTVTDIHDAAHPLSHAYVDAAVVAGLRRNPDFNGSTQEGVGFYQLTTRHGLRCSAATAYLAPARRRANLRLMTRAEVTRVIFDGRRACAVEIARGGRRLRIEARCEVILSAGAIASPQILQRSGIGHPGLMNALGIAVTLPAPGVGRNLQDHIGLDYIYEATRPTLNDVLRTWWGRMMVGAQYAATRSGPLSLSVNQGGGFFRTDARRDRPNMQLYFSPLSYTRGNPDKRALMKPDPFSGFMIGLSNCHPASRGTLEIRSADPAAPPVIRPGYLSAPEDLAELVQGVRMLRRIAAAAPMCKVIREELVPGPSVRDDDDLAADIVARAGSVFHPCGTCAMGPDPKTGAVVDAHLRVHGIDALRVVDASIFPRITSGNINAPTLMVGEKGAAMILDDRRR